jgi:type I restriction enzyme S subunit
MLTHWVAPREVESRIDAEYYKPEYVENEQRILKAAPCARLDDLRDPKRPITNGIRGPELAPTDYRMLRLQNTDELWIDSREALRVSEAQYIENRRAHCLPGDLLLAIGGYIGVVGKVIDVAPQTMGQHTARLSLDEAKIDRDYLLAFLSAPSGAKLCQRFVSGGVQAGINLEDVREIRVPVPAREIQRAIGNKLRRAEWLRSERIRLIEEAQTGIEKLVSPTIASKTQTRRGDDREEYAKICDTPPAWSLGLKSLSVGRLDASYYEPRYLDSLNSLRSLPMEISDLRSLCSKLNCGSTPKQVSYGYAGVPLIRTGNVRPNHYDDRDVERVPGLSIRPESNVAILPGDVLYTMSGTIGHAAVFPAQGEIATCSNTIARARIADTSRVDPYYVALFLNCTMGRMQSLRFVSGGVLGHVMPTSVKKLLIALPNVDAQRELGGRLRTAERHRTAEWRLVGDARADVEALISGTLQVQRLIDDDNKAQGEPGVDSGARRGERKTHARHA